MRGSVSSWFYGDQHLRDWPSKLRWAECTDKLQHFFVASENPSQRSLGTITAPPETVL